MVFWGGQKVFNPTPTAEYLTFVMSRFSTRRSARLSGEGPRNSEPVEQNPDIIWLGKSWICNKQLEHYLAFSRDETTIPAHSFVWTKSENGKDLVGYLLDLYETQQGEKMAKVRWFHYQDEVKNLAPAGKMHLTELVMTRLEQDVSADCVDGLAVVLSPTHFNKCVGVIKAEMAIPSFLCHREIRTMKAEPNSLRVKSYNITNLWGYSTQPILSYLICHYSTDEIGASGTLEKRESSRRIKSFRDARTLANVTGGTTTLGAEDWAADCLPPRKKLRFRLPSRQDDKVVDPEPQSRISVKLDDNIELLSQDSGMQGCWFRCKVLQRKQKRLKVRYYDVYGADESQNLEEWVSSATVAGPDRLGMRWAGRLTVRPWPSEGSCLSEHVFEIGEAVDAWWTNGWWEGVVIGYATPGPDNLLVYFSGENRFLTIARRNIRVSRDWVEDKWVNVKSNPNILSYFTSGVSHMPKVPPYPPLPPPPPSPPPPPPPLPLPLEAAPSSGDERGLRDLSLRRRILIRHNEETRASNSRDTVHVASLPEREGVLRRIQH